MDTKNIKQLFQNKWIEENNELDHSMIKLCSHLSVLRKVAGWSAEDFSSKIGVTKQTVNAIESMYKPNISKDNTKDKCRINYQTYFAIRCLFEREIMTRCNPLLAHVYKYFLFHDNWYKGYELIIFDETLEHIRKIVKSETIRVMSEYCDSLISNKRVLTDEMPLNIALINPSNPEVIKLRQDNVKNVIDTIDAKCKKIYSHIGVNSKDDFYNIDYDNEATAYAEWKDTFFDTIERKESPLYKSMIVSEEYIVAEKTHKKIERLSQIERGGWSSIYN